MSSIRRNIVVGLTVICSLLAFGWLLLHFSPKVADWFAPQQTLVEFDCDRADGLSEGSAINFLGVHCGKVTQVRRSDDNKSVIIMATIDEAQHLPANVEGHIVQGGLLGSGSSISLELTANKRSGELASGAVVRAKYVGLQLNLLPPDVAKAAGELGDLADQLRQSGMINDLDKTVRQINVAAAKTAKVLDDAELIVGDEQNRENIQVSISNIRKTTDTASVVADKLTGIADSLRATSDSADSAVKDTQARVDDLSHQVSDRLVQASAILTTLQSITAKVDKGQGTAGKIVNDARLYESLVDSSKELDATIADLRRVIDQWEQEGVTLKLK